MKITQIMNNNKNSKTETIRRINNNELREKYETQQSSTQIVNKQTIVTITINY